MQHFIVEKSTLSGTISAPSSKSHSLRAILFASLAKGNSQLSNVLRSPDVDAMIKACRQLGAKIEKQANSLNIIGVSGKPNIPDDIINAGNSGQVLRFIAAIAGLIDGYTILTGDHSVRHNRPLKPLMDGLSCLGVTCISSKGDNHAPLIVKGLLQAGKVMLDGEDSQPVSGLLIAAAFAKGITEIHVTNPGELPWIDVTLNWLQRMNVRVEHQNYQDYKIYGNNTIAGFNYTVPGDFSSIAYPLAAALITRSHITINNVDMKDVQGDKALINLLISMGAKLTIDNENKRLIVKPCETLQGRDINVNPIIDAVPILAVIGCFATGKTRLTNAAVARKKESDRLSAITQELTKMGASITETDDSLTIHQSNLKGVQTCSHKDHRIAMSLATAALNINSYSTVMDVACVAKSYPTFIEDIQKLKGNIKIAD